MRAADEKVGKGIDAYSPPEIDAAVVKDLDRVSGKCLPENFIKHVT